MIRLFELLADHGVPFVVIGGHAVSFHGYIRATEDHDIVFIRSRESETALFEACRELDAAWISDEIDPQTGIERLIPVAQDYIQNQHLMMLCTSEGYLDVFDYIPGFPEASTSDLFETSHELDGVHFASLEWLKRMKSASGRPRDLDDLDNLP